jgi:hypothetical protein
MQAADMWYSFCLACADPDDPDAGVDKDYVPEEAYWNDLKPPAYPAGVEELTALLVNASHVSVQFIISIQYYFY